ncbi:glycosyltransferase [Vibrio cyclitrophicus]|uniref:glycosyltransferase n=1 Tax=Vibrio cyclitrophicus TaxID=47951 RepID=UPI000302A408|nr:glycosyltransferase [Vibrio cyclitrophicus]OEE10479.1 hypothetical protein OC1_16715 [Vibrio cyclitrophicus ZF207]
MKSIDQSNRIGFFIPALSGGGAERVFLNLVEYYASKGIDVVLIVNKKEGALSSCLPSDITLIELNARNILLSFYSLSKLIRKLRLTHLVTTVRGANITAAFSRIFFNDYLWVLREANTFTNVKFEKGLKEKLISYSCKYLYFFCDKLIANSNDTLDDINKFCIGNIVSKAKVIPNPVFWEKKHNPPSFEVRKISKVSKLVSVGRLEKQKNFFYQIDLIKKLKQKGHDVTLDIYGEGKLFNDLSQYIEQQGCTDYIAIKEFDVKLMDKIHQYDCFILSSLWEGFGNVIIESMSNGLKLFISDVPGGPRYIDFSGLDLVEKYKLDDDIECNVELLINLILKEKSQEEFNFLLNRAKLYSVENVALEYLEAIVN